MSLLRSVVELVVGEETLKTIKERSQTQSQLAIFTSLLAIAANVATLTLGYQSFPTHVYWMSCGTLFSFATVPMIYRWLVPRFEWAFELANNIVPATLCFGCGYSAVTMGGSLPLAAIYASATPLLSVMICRRPLALLWSALMILMLAVGIVVGPNPDFVAPSWMSLAGGISVVIPTLISMLLHRNIWESALSESAEARSKLRDQHELQRALDKRIATFERQESLGLMAGRVTHDLNNLLTAVLTSVELCKIAIEKEQPEEVVSSVQTIEYAVQNAGKLSAQLLDYTGKTHHTMVPINLADRLATTIALGQAASPEGTQVTYETVDEAWLLGDPNQLDQVIVNLIRNAAQAYEPDSGTVQVAIKLMTTSAETECINRRILPPGQYVQLQVRDRGCGVPVDDREKIFEPFYTNRKTGHGLGLAAVAGIVAAHGGGLQVRAFEPTGTDFYVLLPSGNAMQHSESTAGTAGSLSRHITGRMGTLLVVDDEQAVRESIAKLLLKLGCAVESACDGEKALALMEEGHNIAGVVLDVSMPRMDGYETLARIRQTDECLPVLLISGYARSSETQPNDDPYTDWLAKPFSASDLKAWISRTALSATVVTSS